MSPTRLSILIPGSKLRIRNSQSCRRRERCRQHLKRKQESARVRPSSTRRVGKLTLSDVRTVLSHGETDIGSLESWTIIDTITCKTKRREGRSDPERKSSSTRRDGRGRLNEGQTSHDGTALHAVDVPSMNRFDHSNLGLRSCEEKGREEVSSGKKGLNI